MEKLDVLMVIEGEIATTQLLERVLLACEPYGLCYRKQFLHSLRVQDFYSGTIPLFVRCGDPALEFWVDLLDRAKHPFLYYIDDNFWRIEGGSALAQYYRHPRIRRSLEYITSRARCVLTNSEELSTFLYDLNNERKVLPTFFDFSLIEKVVPNSNEEVRIGFAGSPSRKDDLDIIAPLIQPILDSFPHAVFEFAGAMPRGVVEGDRVRFFPHTSEYNTFIRFQAERGWVIGLAPLFDTEANRCKTNNKYREYGACCIAGVYSDLDLYRQSVSGGSTGILVENNTEAWLSALHRLLACPEERRQIGQRAYEDVRKNFCVNQVALEWFNEFSRFSESISEKPLSLSSVYSRAKIQQLYLKLKGAQIRISAAFSEGGILLVFKKAVYKIKNFKKMYKN